MYQKTDGAAILDAHTGAEVVRIGPGRMVFSVDFSPDGSRVATGDSSGNVEVWQAVTWERLWGQKERKTIMRILACS